MQLKLFRGAVATAVLLGSACGDDGATAGGTGGAGGEQPCGIQACDSGSGGQGGEGGGGSEGGGTQCGLDPVANDELCRGDAPPIDCDALEGEDHDLCGVALGAVPEGSGAFDASCFDPASYPPPPGATGTTRLEGHVRIFSNGCESSNVTVEVFTIQDSGDLGAQIGLSATTPGSCAETGEQSPSESCEARYECAFVYPSVPTETLLAVRTSGPGWTPVIDYGVYVTNDAASSGAFRYDPRVVATDDYGVIAQAAMGHPVTPGNGMILGEVRDCAASPVEAAVVGTDADPVALTYFTSNEDDPLPDLSATSTGTYGLWGALDVAPGAARTAAAADVDGTVTSLGTRDVLVFPDTITWVTFAGPLPTQIPAD